jgi:hypothetical protein
MRNIGAIITVALILATVLVMPRVLKIKTECQSQYGQCPKEIKNQTSFYDGKSLYLAKKGIKKDLSANYLVSDFSTQFKLPNILLVSILIKKPIFALKNATSNSVVTVGSDGKVLSISDTSVLPTIITQETLVSTGEYVGDSNLFALNLIQGISQMYQVNTAKIENDSLVVELPGSLEVIFPLEGDYQVLLGSLRLIYSKVQTEQPGKYRELDLRFKNPVLR